MHFSWRSRGNVAVVAGLAYLFLCSWLNRTLNYFSQTFTGEEKLPDGLQLLYIWADDFVTELELIGFTSAISGALWEIFWFNLEYFPHTDGKITYIFRRGPFTQLSVDCMKNAMEYM